LADFDFSVYARLTVPCHSFITFSQTLQIAS
jgi:hypothetical protein